MTRARAFLGIAALALAVGLWMGMSAPPDALQGVFSRIINVHVPSLWLAFLAFAVTAIGSVMWLLRKRPLWDRLAMASAEVGVLFTAIGLATGMIWGQRVWGTAWDWGDPRLTTTAVMFFVYLGYLALRGAIEDPVVRARRSAILGAVAVVQVPLVYFSVYMFRTLHQTPSIRPDGSTMPSEMLIAMLVNVAAFTILYVALVMARIEVAVAEESASDAEAMAGAAVQAPRLSEVGDV